GPNGNGGTPGSVEQAAQAPGFIDQLNYIFFNRAPSVAPTQSPAGGDGKQITVNLNGAGNNGFMPTYAITSQPKYGELRPAGADGVYTYIPDKNLVVPGITDRFTVTVDNGTRAQRPGLLGAVQRQLQAIAVVLGVAQSDTVTKEITVTVPGTGEYGNLDNSKWWLRQTYENCTLMAGAMAVRQLTQSMKPTEKYMVDLAKSTNSVYSPGNKMYLDENTPEGVANDDLVALMTTKLGVSVVTTKFGPTRQDGLKALTALEAALAQGKAAMVGVNADVIWTAADTEASKTPSYTSSNHVLVVIKVDAKAGMVYLNDSGPAEGQGMKVPLGALLSAWQGDYQLYVVSKAAPKPA
ncbi:MAG: hypothetical protein ACR2JM_09400, partial [Mycobacterium sp.]